MDRLAFSHGNALRAAGRAPRSSRPRERGAGARPRCPGSAGRETQLGQDAKGSSRWERVEESQPGVPTSADVDVTDEPQAGKAAIGEGVQAQANPPRRHRGRGRDGGYQAQVPSVPEPGPSRFRPTGGDGAPPEPRRAIDSEALYQKQVVSTTACRVRRTMPRPNTTKSRRRPVGVGSPSPRPLRGPRPSGSGAVASCNRRRCSPPRSPRCAPRRDRCSPPSKSHGSGSIGPSTPSRATPPSGITVSRMWVKRSGSWTSKMHVGEAPWIVDLEDVVVAAPQRRRRHELDPIGLGTLECPPPG
jgi:hypothetical protein